MFLPDNKLRRLPPKLAAADFIAKEQPIRTFDTSTDGVLRLFTSHGACLTLRVEDIPETKPQAKPTNLSAVFELEQDEKLLAICDEDFLSARCSSIPAADWSNAPRLPNT